MITSFLFQKKNLKSGSFGGCQAAKGGKGVIASFLFRKQIPKKKTEFRGKTEVLNRGEKSNDYEFPLSKKNLKSGSFGGFQLAEGGKRSDGEFPFSSSFV